MNLNAQTFHSCAIMHLHGTLHQIYVFLSKIGIQSEKWFLDLIKASERLSGRKKTIQTDWSLQRVSNPNRVGDRQ